MKSRLNLVKNVTSALHSERRCGDGGGGGGVVAASSAEGVRQMPGSAAPCDVINVSRDHIHPPPPPTTISPHQPLVMGDDDVEV